MAQWPVPWAQAACRDTGAAGNANRPTGMLRPGTMLLRRFTAAHTAHQGANVNSRSENEVYTSFIYVNKFTMIFTHPYTETQGKQHLKPY